jgi:hypothetical protein
MRNFNSRTNVTELVVKGIIALIIIFVLVQVFKAIFAVVAALLTIAIIGVGVVILLKLLNRPRY